jgi:hypothetical protein
VKTCIKMSCGNVYVAEGSIDEWNTILFDTDEPSIKIENADKREPFFLNPLQVCSVYPAWTE